jgi:hypothetical protein
MIFGQKMKLIIITIIKHHNSKHYIHSIFIHTYDNYPCLLQKYRFKISRMLTKHFRSELFDDSDNWVYCFFLHWWRCLIFFSQEIRPAFSMLNAKRFEIVYVLPHLYIMYSNVKPPVTLRNYQPVAWYQWVIDQSKADIVIKPGII